MNLEKLSAIAKREMRRSPKKTVLLGLMCVVALYYWVPIVKGIFGGSSDAEELANNGLIVPTAPATPTLMPIVCSAPPEASEKRLILLGRVWIGIFLAAAAVPVIDCLLCCCCCCCCRRFGWWIIIIIIICCLLR